MRNEQKLPIVIYQGGPGRPGWRFGYLVRDPSGNRWLVPNQERAGDHPLPAGSFLLDAQELGLQPDTGADRELYLYQRAALGQMRVATEPSRAPKRKRPLQRSGPVASKNKSAAQDRGER
jgi:hypothetical protein